MTKQKKIAAAIALIVVVAILIVSIFLMSGHTGGASSPVQDVAIEVLEPLSKEEGAALTGVCDRTLAPGAVDNLDDFIEKDDTIVKSVTIDASKIDFAKAGEYEATYEITLDKSALDAWLQENDRSVAFQQDSDPIILRTVATITIQEDATTTDQGKSDDKTTNKETSDSTTDKESNPSSNQSSGTSSNKNNGSSGGSSNKNNGSSGGSSSGSSSQSSHQHHWVSRKVTEEVPETVVVSEKTQKYTNYHIYWYNTGTWEDTRDASRFKEWSRSENGQLYPLKHYKNPEDNPLFLGYDSNGNPTYTNDHTITTGYETVPCEPYEKTEMVKVTKTIQVCSICGATK